MPQLPRTPRSKGDSIKDSADYLDASYDEGAHPRPATHKSEDPTSTQNDTNADANISIVAATSKLDKVTSSEPHSYLIEDVAKQVINKHEKPVRDKYHADLEAIREGCKDTHSGHTGSIDRNSLEGTAKLKLEARLRAIQPAIVKDALEIVDLIVEEEKRVLKRELKQRLATLKRDRRREAQGKPAKFTKAEVKEAREAWARRRAASWLPVDGDCDDLAPPSSPEPASEQKDSGSTAKKTPSPDTPAEDQPNADSPDEPIDLDSESEEGDDSESAFPFDGIETPGSEI